MSRWWYWALGAPTIAILWAVSALWTGLGVTAAGVSLGGLGVREYVALPLVALGPPLVVVALVLPFALERDTDGGEPAVADSTPYEYGAWFAVGIGLISVAWAVATSGTAQVDAVVFGAAATCLVDAAVSVAYLRARTKAVGLRPLPTRSA